MRHTFYAAVAAVAMLASAPAFAAPAVSGVYAVQGWNPATAPTAPADYMGTLTLTPKDGGLAADWAIGANKEHTEGIGLMREVGGKYFLSIAYENGGEPGIAIYDVSPDGKLLNGIWGKDGKGREQAKH